MILAIDLFNGSTLIGILGIITIPMSVIFLALAMRKTQEASAWKGDAAAAREGMNIANDRLARANEWNATVEGKYEERERVIHALEERAKAQAEHIRHRDEQIQMLLERSPEKLWEAFMLHSEEAKAHWEMEKSMLDTNLAILEELRAIRKEANGHGEAPS